MKQQSSGRWKRIVAGAGIIAATLALPAIASASIPTSSTGEIKACYGVSTGALRVIDTETGQACQASERPLSWPAAGASATQYETASSVYLPQSNNNTMVLPGPVLPAGTWNVTMGAIIINSTSQTDTLRCGLWNGASALLRGDATSIPAYSYQSISLPLLVTYTTPDRVNVMCWHDVFTPNWEPRIQIYYANVVAQRVATRF